MERKPEVILNTNENWFTKALDELEKNNDTTTDSTDDTDNSNVIYVDFRPTTKD